MWAREVSASILVRTTTGVCVKNNNTEVQLWSVYSTDRECSEPSELCYAIPHNNSYNSYVKTSISISY